MSCSFDNQLWKSALRRYIPWITFRLRKSWRVIAEGHQSNSTSESKFWESLRWNKWSNFPSQPSQNQKRITEVHNNSEFNETPFDLKIARPWNYLSTQLKNCYHVYRCCFCSTPDVSKWYIWGPADKDCQLDIQVYHKERLQDWRN